MTLVVDLVLLATFVFLGIAAWQWVGLMLSSLSKKQVETQIVVRLALSFSCILMSIMIVGNIFLYE
jgi:hypothetical protein